MAKYYTLQGLLRSPDTKGDTKRLGEFIYQLDGICVGAMPDEFLKEGNTDKSGMATYLINHSVVTIDANVGVLGEDPAGYIRVSAISISSEELRNISEGFNKQYSGLLPGEPFEIGMVRDPGAAGG